MIKYRNKVVTRDELNEAKRIHKESYEKFVETRRKLYNSTENKSLVDTVVFATKAMQLSRPKSMRQCVNEVINKRSNNAQGESNGI